MNIALYIQSTRRLTTDKANKLIGDKRAGAAQVAVQMSDSQSRGRTSSIAC